MNKNSSLVTKKYLVLCGDLIAEKMDKGDISNWPNSDYQRLSYAIWRENKVRLSVNTLKRIFGKAKTEEHYAPNVTTLDILAVFLNYRDWQHFKAKNQIAVSSIALQPETVPSQLNENSHASISRKKQFVSYLPYIAMALIICLGSFGLLFWKKNERAYQDIRIFSRNPGENIFNSVPFELIFPAGFKGRDSLLLDFDDGQQEKLNLEKRKRIHYFDVPGRYKVKLSYKNKLVDSAVVIVGSKGWFAYARMNSPLKRFPLIDFDGSMEGMSKVTNKAISKIGVDTLGEFSLNFVNFKKTDISGDNFELVSNVKTSDQIKGAECGQVFFLVLGQLERHLISIVDPSCTDLAAAYFSEQERHGQAHDLGTLGHSLKEGGTVKLLVKNKQVTVCLNDKVIYATNYKKPIGKIAGVRVFFSGCGELKSFSLKDLETGKLF